MGCKLTESLWWDNFKVLELENELVKIILMPQRGGEIHQIHWKQTGLDFLSSARPDLPGFEIPGPDKPLSQAENQAFSSFYTLFPNAGQAGNYENYFYEFHGDIRTVEWSYTVLENTPATINIRLEAVSNRLPLKLNRQLVFEKNSARLSFCDELLHTGPATGQFSELPFIYGFHPYHTYPLLDEGTIFRIGGITVKTLPGRDTPLMERFYVDSSLDGCIEVFNPQLNATFRLEYDSALLKYSWVWFVSDPAKDIYQGALLPCTAYNVPANGILAAVSNKTARWLKPGQRLVTRWAIAVQAFPPTLG